MQTGATETTGDDVRWWWLSFADATRPTGTQCLGVSIVRAMSLQEAVKAAWVMDCNPGGEVFGGPALSEDGDPPAEYASRLLTKDEAQACMNVWHPENPRCATLAELQAEDTS